MRLVENWKAVLLRAWSVRLIAGAAVLTGLEAILPLVGDIFPFDSHQIAAVTFVITLAAFVARIVAQKDV